MVLLDAALPIYLQAVPAHSHCERLATPREPEPYPFMCARARGNYTALIGPTSSSSTNSIQIPLFTKIDRIDVALIRELLTNYGNAVMASFLTGTVGICLVCTF